MRKHISFLTLLSFATLLLASPVFAGSKVALPQHVPAAVARLHPMGRLAGDHKMTLAIGVPLRNEAQLDVFIDSLQDPASPNYHQFLTPQEFTEKFGPTKADYEAVNNFAKAHHLKVTRQHANRLVLDVEANAADVESAFGVKFNVYNHPREQRTFFAPDAEPIVDATVPILHITGLENYSLPHPKFHVKGTNTANATPHTGSGPGGSYWGNDFRNAYVPNTSLTGAGQAVGLLQFDGFYANDVSRYASQSGLPRVPLTVVPVDGGIASPTDGNGEVCLDIEMAMAMAPGLSRIYVYEAPNPSPWPDLLNQMANDNLAKQLSTSWGGGGPDPTCEAIFKQMAAQGQTFFNASGDDDAFTGSIDFPSESTNIVQVGGTTLTTSSSGAYVSETVWNWGGGTGSSGGISQTYPMPSYQQGISMTKNGGSTSRRNIPDVALTADNVYVIYGNVSSDIFGGTSCAAPLWAGLTALINQQATANSRSPVGFINPAMYAIGKSAGYASAFHDVATGNNTSSSSPNQFYAVPGYDLCTGWGTPNGSAFIDMLAGPADGFGITPATGFTATGGVGGPFDVTSVTFALTNSGDTTFNWQVSTPAPWLSVSAAGGTLSGNSTGTVDVTLTAIANTLTRGTYTTTVIFTNKSTGITQNRDFTLNILGAPTITSQPESQTANQGDTVTFSGSAMGLNPLSYQWTFNGTNISDATDSVLTISNVRTANSGTYNLVVANSGGTTTSSNAVLVVNGRPVNDQCSGALEITGDSYSHVESTLLATSTGDPTPSCAFEFGNAVWFTWTAPADGLVAVDTIGTSFDTVLAVYSGDCGALTRVDCDDDSGGNLTSKLTYVATAGVSYYYMVGGYSAATGQLVFHFKINHPLAITLQPDDEPSPLGANATFSVVASGGTAPLKYQWYSSRNGGLTMTKLLNHTNSDFILQRASSLLPQQYNVVVSDSATPPNVVTSRLARVMLYTAPRFTVQPASLTRIAGNDVAFRAVAVGTAPLSYQWNLEGAPVYGATNSLISLTNVQSVDGGHYQCVVTGAFGSTAITGLMRGNLTVLPDSDTPTVAIVSPLKNSVLTSGLRVGGQTNFAPALRIFARTHDFGRVTDVSLIRTYPDSAPLTNSAALLGGTVNLRTWSSDVTLVPGVNTFVAEATDTAGHTKQSAPVNYILKTP